MNETQVQPNTFAIKTEVFEGPLELLLDLVEKRKLLINDISLASVTDEYMAHVSRMQEMSLPNTTNFVALAATLLLIKSKSLLPVLDLTPEEEGSIEELEERLKLYQIYRDAGKIVAEAFGEKVAHERLFINKTEPIFVTDKFCDLGELSSAMYRILQELPVIKKEPPKVRVRKVVSLEEMIDKLHDRVQKQIKTRFSELVGNDKEKTTAVVAFLAILESVKQGSILAAQLERYGDIEIEHSGSNVPNYR